jgi:hypothetical protein
MKIIELKEREDSTNDNNIDNCYIQFKEVLSELRKKELPDTTVVFINKNVEELNGTLLLDEDLQKHIKKQQTNILKLVLKEHKIVPKKQYRKLWMILGISAFGIPIGLAFSLGINMELFGLGLPIGMGIGIIVGSRMDKKALKEERQLNIEIKN